MPVDPLDALAPFVGAWKMKATFEGAPPTDGDARVTFEAMPGGRFLIERWEIHMPDAPPEVPTSGIAIIGADPERAGEYLQHYFDSRGVARVYKMSFRDGVWTLLRDEPDFSPFEFAQRFTGTFSEDGATITGTWEVRKPGQPWKKDFDLAYLR